MHHCLTIQEIIGIICSHLAPIVPSPVRRSSRQPEMKDLACLARTCRAFQDPALDFLWRYSTFLNLLRCMGTDLWTVDEVTEWSGKIKCCLDSLRPIHIADWDRVVAYARRIHHISSSDNDCDLSKIFPMISICFPLELFRNLRGLHWYHSGPQFQYIHLFLTSDVTSISFNANCVSAVSLHPILKDVSIGYEETTPVSAFVRSLTSIESLSVASLDQGALEHLCRLPTLTSFSLTNLIPLTSSGLLPFSPSADIQPFRVLQKLRLTVTKNGDMTLLFERCNQLPLKLLDISIWLPATTAETHNLLTSLSMSISRSSLTDLSLYQGYSSLVPSNFPIFSIQGQSLRPLLSFSNLLSINLTLLVEIDLDNATISDLARAWPRIEQLALSSHYPSTSRRATLQCLHSFARFCPHLANLTITLDGTDLEKGIGCSVFQHALKRLNVEFSPISAAIPVARFISAIFPNLRNVETNCDDPDNMDLDDLSENEEAVRFYHLWKEVESLLPDLLTIPAEERVWGRNHSDL
ncbi:hypothetical protein B0H11DRAFT_1819984 [Mycena galericulata]|nr:hypothetical protein B0H11DRAFT_1819984 [Mycena galericulata]